MKRRCPVCRRIAHPTRNRNIAQHLDRAGNFCPMSGEPHDLALITNR